MLMKNIVNKIKIGNIDRRVVSTLLFLFVLLGSLSFFYTYFDEEIEEKVFVLATENVQAIACDYAAKLNQEYADSNIRSGYFADLAFRDRLEDNLQLLVAGNIKYAFILYREKEGVYRYLADGTEGAEHSVFDEKFSSVAKEWEIAYSTREHQWISHGDSVMLGLTFIEPLIDETGVAGFLVVDFSTASINQINEILSDIHDIVIFLFFLLFIVGLSVVYYDFRYVNAAKLATTDSLTKLYNRTKLKELNLDFDHYVVALLDIDFFKHVNDTYGHDCGDFVLVELAKRMTDIFSRSKDYVVRYGGEEFLLLIERGASKQKSLDCISRLHKAINGAPFIFAGNEMKITASIGVNMSMDSSDTLNGAIKLADVALYKAKDSGRDRVIVYRKP